MSKPRDPQTGQWFATTSTVAPMLRHRLGPAPTDPPHSGSRKALCGESHNAETWQPVEWFVRPGLFAPCRLCAGLADDEEAR